MPTRGRLGRCLARQSRMTPPLYARAGGRRRRPSFLRNHTARTTGRAAILLRAYFKAEAGRFRPLLRECFLLRLEGRGRLDAERVCNPDRRERASSGGADLVLRSSRPLLSEMRCRSTDWTRRGGEGRVRCRAHGAWSARGESPAMLSGTVTRTQLWASQASA